MKLCTLHLYFILLCLGIHYVLQAESYSYRRLRNARRRRQIRRRQEKEEQDETDGNDETEEKDKKQMIILFPAEGDPEGEVPEGTLSLGELAGELGELGVLIAEEIPEGQESGGEIPELTPFSNEELPEETECKCGVDFGSDERIVGGRPAEPNEYPWQIALTLGNSIPFCGGVLISDLYVLTAGHCLEGNHPDEVMVLLGEHDVNDQDDKGFHIPVEELIPHPDYDDVKVINDIGLVRMKEKVPFSDITQPPCFPEPDKDYEEEIGVVTGWGLLEEGGDTAGTLQTVEVPITPLEECKTKYFTKFDITDNMICATTKEGGKDACAGDSGGPFVWKDNGRWFLIGIVSYGLGCARPNTPAMYTRVDKFYQWIEENTNDKAKTCTDEFRNR